MAEAGPSKVRRLTADESSVGLQGSLAHSSLASPSSDPTAMVSGQSNRYQTAAEATSNSLEAPHSSRRQQRLELASDVDSGGHHFHGTDLQAVNNVIIHGNTGGASGDPDQEGAPEGPLTETIAAGLISMRQRRAAIEQQIDELTHVAVDYLEGMKKDFIERMARLKNNVAIYCNGQHAEWRETNNTTQDAMRRLDAARALVRSLGLDAHQGSHELSRDVVYEAGHANSDDLESNRRRVGEGGGEDGTATHGPVYQDGSMGIGI